MSAAAALLCLVVDGIIQFLLRPPTLEIERRWLHISLASCCCSAPSSPAAPVGEHGSSAIPFPSQFSRCYQRPTTTTDLVLSVPQASPPASATGSSSPPQHASGAALVVTSPAAASVLPAPVQRPPASLSLRSHPNFAATTTDPVFSALLLLLQPPRQGPLQHMALPTRSASCQSSRSRAPSRSQRPAYTSSCSSARFTGHGSASSPARGRLSGRKARQARRKSTVPECPDCPPPCDLAARVSVRGLSARSELRDHCLPCLCPPTPVLALVQASRRRVLGRQTALAREPTVVARPRGWKAGRLQVQPRLSQAHSSPADPPAPPRRLTSDPAAPPHTPRLP